MTTHYKTKAFVFSRKDVSDCDRNFSVFTEDFGRMDVFAKAIRKINSKLKSGIDVFYLSEIEFIQGKNKKTLTSALPIKKSSSVILDKAKFKAARDISDILDLFLKGQEKDIKLFSLIQNFLRRLDEASTTYDFEILHQCFFWNFVRQQGFDYHEISGKSESAEIKEAIEAILNENLQAFPRIAISQPLLKSLKKASEKSKNYFCPENI